MSQSDSFIDEVTEEVRRDRLFATFRKYGWVAAIAVVVIVGGAAYYEYSRAQATAEAEAFGDALLVALEQGEPAERAAALDAVQPATPDGAVVVALTRSAELAKSGDIEAAVDALGVIADNAEMPVAYRSLAAYRQLALQADTLSTEERRAGYEELTGAGAPLRLMALEQIAMTHVEDGNRDEALLQLQGLLDEDGVTPDLLRRISQLIVVLGGTPGEAAETTDG